jgi:hypothetical protein
VSTVDPQTPAFVLDAADSALRHGEGVLMEAMLGVDEDITDDRLWRHRRSQFLSLLTSRAAARNAELAQRIAALDKGDAR